MKPIALRITLCSLFLLPLLAGRVAAQTSTPTQSPTRTRTITRTPTLTRTITQTPTITLTRTITQTPTITMTPTVTPTFTVTPTNTVSPTPSGTPVPLPMDSSAMVQCQTCHDMHFSTSSDGSLVRNVNINQLCGTCHTLSDLSASAHASPDIGAQWPGGDVHLTSPSNFPAISDASKKGYCTNCHAVHGWPDVAVPTPQPTPGNLSTDYPALLVERTDQYDNQSDPDNTDENLCYSCHDQDGPAVKRVWTATDGDLFPNSSSTGKKIHHPIRDIEQRTRAGLSAGRSVECRSCHNVHQAQANAHTYSSTSKAIRYAAACAINCSPTTLIRITSDSHGFVNGDTVTLVSVGGVTAANGLWRIANVTPNTFDLVGSTFSGAYTSGGTAIIASNVNRNLVSPPLTRVSGVSVSYTGVTAFVEPPSANYTAIPETTGSTYEYQVCFKCHSGYNNWQGAGTAPSGLSPNGTVNNPVETNLAQEFNPANASFHPVLVGLNSGTGNGTAALQPLTTTQLLAPWNTNVGTQTMKCSDCHSTDAASPAAQGPHGSAVNFMLRSQFGSTTGPTAWPDVLLNSTGNTGNSFCTNCHILNGGRASNVHNRDNHYGASGGMRCYNCHIVIPHGGKLARLIGDGDSTNMPTRYAYSNTRSNLWVTGFTKSSSYSESSCSSNHSGCTSNHNGTATSW